ncbi:VENN motif pre-toxin domain-containing protein [Escherichia coli]|uniref:VENN motif pre-toxin domain-containing protein n=1 Tax=Escherichia coli TaxID=562 RepID=UPI0038B358E8
MNALQRVAGGTAPYIAEIIKQTTPDGAGRVAAHAVVNAALAVAQGNNALAGAAGAATGEVVGMIATQMYGRPVSELSETEKQTVSTLATVAAGLAGGLVGDSGLQQWPAHSRVRRGGGEGSWFVNWLEFCNINNKNR